MFLYISVTLSLPSISLSLFVSQTYPNLKNGCLPADLPACLPTPLPLSLSHPFILSITHSLSLSPSPSLFPDKNFSVVEVLLWFDKLFK